MKRTIALIAAFAACSAAGGRSLDPAAFDARSREAGAVLIDVREPAEFAAGRLEGARLLPGGELEARLAELPADKKAPILVYCARGGRSAKAARLLREKGYESVHDLAGGLAAWTDAGKPVVK